MLTEAQLIEGLFEQNRTGNRLGKVLIDLGFVDAPSVAMALATQHGGPLKTEYGFATGFDPGGPTEPVMKPPLDPDPVTSQPLSSELRLTDQPDVTAGESPARAEVIASPEHGAVASERPAVPASPDENARGESESDAAFSEPQTVLAEHDQTRSRAGATIVEPDAARAELEAANTRIADLERELVAAREQLDERRSKCAELEDELAAAKLAAETAIEALRRVTGARP
ncbi:MAG: hypothetical protein ACM3QU_07470 [Verrucomicrobiota bacterium]